MPHRAAAAAAADAAAASIDLMPPTGTPLLPASLLLLTPSMTPGLLAAAGLSQPSSGAAAAAAAAAASDAAPSTAAVDHEQTPSTTATDMSSVGSTPAAGAGGELALPAASDAYGFRLGEPLESGVPIPGTPNPYAAATASGGVSVTTPNAATRQLAANGPAAYAHAHGGNGNGIGNGGGNGGLTGLRHAALLLASPGLALLPGPSPSAAAAAASNAAAAAAAAAGTSTPGPVPHDLLNVRTPSLLPTGWTPALAASGFALSSMALPPRSAAAHAASAAVAPIGAGADGLTPATAVLLVDDGTSPPKPFTLGPGAMGTGIGGGTGSAPASASLLPPSLVAPPIKPEPPGTPADQPMPLPVSLTAASSSSSALHHHQPHALVRPHSSVGIAMPPTPLSAVLHGGGVGGSTTTSHVGLAPGVTAGAGAAAAIGDAFRFLFRLPLSKPRAVLLSVAVQAAALDHADALAEVELTRLSGIVGNSTPSASSTARAAASGHTAAAAASALEAERMARQRLELLRAFQSTAVADPNASAVPGGVTVEALLTPLPPPFAELSVAGSASSNAAAAAAALAAAAATPSHSVPVPSRSRKSAAAAAAGSSSSSAAGSRQRSGGVRPASAVGAAMAAAGAAGSGHSSNSSALTPAKSKRGDTSAAAAAALGSPATQQPLVSASGRPLRSTAGTNKRTRSPPAASGSDRDDDTSDDDADDAPVRPPKQRRAAVAASGSAAATAAAAAAANAFAGSTSCHQCKSKCGGSDAGGSDLLYCSSHRVNVSSEPRPSHRKRRKRAHCRKKYCERCITNRYHEHVPSTPTERANWVCPSCRGICVCTSCTRERDAEAAAAVAAEMAGGGKTKRC